MPPLQRRRTHNDFTGKNVNTSQLNSTNALLLSRIIFRVDLLLFDGAWSGYLRIIISPDTSLHIEILIPFERSARRGISRDLLEITIS
jgi:hypothetical protein